MEVRDQIECLNLGVTGELVGPFSEQEVPNRQAQGPRHGQASARSQSSPLAATMTYPISPRRPLISTSIYSLVSFSLQRLSSTRHYHSQRPAQPYNCNVNAEPLYRYRPGGYHPLELGDALKNGRYKILHKLGWGSYSTTWAAKDQKYVYLTCNKKGRLLSNSLQGTTAMLQ